MQHSRIAVYTRYARHHNALRLVVREYVKAADEIFGRDSVELLVTRDQAGSFGPERKLRVLPFDSDNALLSHLMTLVVLPLISLFRPRTHLIIPQIAFVGPMRGGFTAVVHDLIEWRVRSQSWPKLLARRLLYRSTFHFAQKIVCVSDATRRELLSFFPAYADKCVVVHNGVDALEQVAPVPVAGLEKARFAAVVGYVSEPQKNLLCVIDAFSRVPASRTSQESAGAIDLVFVGPLGLRSDEVLRQGAAKLGDRFRYLGVRSDGEVRWLFENCACALAASRAEGFSLTPAQALYHGARVVASDIAPHKEILKDGAEYFDPSSSEDCARAIRKALEAVSDVRRPELPRWSDLSERLRQALAA